MEKLYIGVKRYADGTYAVSTASPKDKLFGNLGLIAWEEFYEFDLSKLQKVEIEANVKIKDK